jgi:excisionase family DNA binding protein
MRMHKASANDDVMTTREVGQLLGVAVRTVQLWVEAGVLPAWRTAGGHRRIARSAVEKLLAQRKQGLEPGLMAVTLPAPALKMLLVEDDPQLLELFSGMVATWPFPVTLTVASNGFEGLIRMGEDRPDVLVTDLLMPGMDGFQMLRHLTRPKSGFARVRKLVVSAVEPSEIEARGGLPEGVTFFPKPLHYADLQKLVYQHYLDTIVP